MMNPAEFANIAKSEDQFWWYQGMRKIMFAMLDPIAAKRRFERVLEAGSGTGHFSLALQQRYQWPMYPIDLGWEGIEYGKSLGVARQAQADIQALPFASASFDAMLSMDVVVHLPLGDEIKPMREFARVLKPGGLAVIRVSALDALRSRHSEFAMERQRFTKARLLKLSQECGFRALRVTYANSLLLPVAFAKFRIWEPLTNAVPASGVEPVSPVVNQLLSLPLTLESLWLGAGCSFPLGQSIILIAERN
jgi:SAM-dependent methyltransferase